MDDLSLASAVECGALLRERQVSALELVEAALRRIEAEDPAIGAFVEVDGDRAMEQARAIAPDDRRVFAGVPIAIKANTPAEGFTLDYGTRLLAGHKMDHDAHLVRRLRDEGFVIVGTTKLPELGILPTTEPRHGGPARNPWNTDHTPGGSSGGAAAAVAAGMLPMAHGNDGGGSIRVPAACCGLVGLKPSRGRVSRGPDAGDSFLVVDGVLSRTVLDTAAALDVLCGYEAGDATWAPRPTAPYVNAVRRAPNRLRVAVTTANPLGGVDPENAAAVRDVADALEDLGHAVSELDTELPGPEALPLFLTVYAANVSLAALHAQMLAGREAGEDDFEPLSRAMIERAQAASSTEYLAAVTLLQAIARRVIAIWAGCDLLLLPSLAQRPPRIGELTGFDAENPMAPFERAVDFAPFAGLFNVTGQPAITIPAGIGTDGLPTTVQLVGPPLGDDTLLQVAAQLEKSRPWAPQRVTEPPRSPVA